MILTEFLQMMALEDIMDLKYEIFNLEQARDLAYKDLASINDRLNKARQELKQKELSVLETDSPLSVNNEMNNVENIK